MREINSKIVCKLLEFNQKNLLSYALRLTANVAEAKVLLQDTSLVVLSLADEYDENYIFMSWAAGIMRDVFLNREKVKLMRKGNGYDDEPRDDSFVAVCEPGSEYCTRDLETV